MSNFSGYSIHSAEVIEQITIWVRQAGQIALKYFEKTWPSYKPDQTLLTRADLEVQSFLSDNINKTFPTHGLIGEEIDLRINEQETDNIWVIDPIDGTTAFTQGLPGWGISVGVLHNGQPDLGFYYMPLLDDLTYITHHGKVSCKGHILQHNLSSLWSQKGFLAITTTAHQDFQINVRHTRSLGSHGTNLVYTVRKSAVAAFIPKAYLWDLVPGAALLSRVGGEMRYLDGQVINYMQLLNRRLAPQPIIAGHKEILPQLTGMIRPKDK